jgi:hypothetical protein
MLETLGHVFGWIGNAIAVLFLALGIYLQIFIVVAGLVIASFLIARLLRHIFPGRTKS